MDPQRIRVLVAIPTEAVGYMIGKAGRNLNEVSDQTRSKLYLQCHQDIDGNAKDRAIIIEGSLANCLDAMLRLMYKLSTRNDKINANVRIQKWAIPRILCGVLIGRGGDGIKAIHDSTGAWVKVAHVEETSPGDTERLVYIRGSATEITAAAELIKKLVGGHPCSDLPLINKISPKGSIDIPMTAIKYFQLIFDRIHAMNGHVILDPTYDVYIRNNMCVAVDIDTAAAEACVQSVLQEHVDIQETNQITWICVKFMFAKDVFNFIANEQIQNDANESVNLMAHLRQRYNTYVFTSDLAPHVFSKSKPIMCQAIFVGPESMMIEASQYFFTVYRSRGLGYDALIPELPIQKGSDKVTTAPTPRPTETEVPVVSMYQTNNINSRQMPYYVVENSMSPVRPSYYNSNVEFGYPMNLNRYYVTNQPMMPATQQMVYIHDTSLVAPSMHHSMASAPMMHSGGYNMAPMNRDMYLRPSELPQADRRAIGNRKIATSSSRVPSSQLDALSTGMRTMHLSDSK